MFFSPCASAFSLRLENPLLKSHTQCPFICSFNSYVSTLEEVREGDLAMFAKGWRGLEGCEGMVIKRLFRDRDFLAHILIVEANFSVAESEMTEFIKPLKVRRLGA